MTVTASNSAIKQHIPAQVSQVQSSTMTTTTTTTSEDTQIVIGGIELPKQSKNLLSDPNVWGIKILDFDRQNEDKCVLRHFFHYGVVEKWEILDENNGVPSYFTVLCHFYLM